MTEQPPRTSPNVRRARARYTIAHRHLSELARDAVSSPSALVRAAASRELERASAALREAAEQIASALGPQGPQVRT